MDEIYEQTTAILTLTFTDAGGSSIVPDTITYTLYDKFSGTVRTTGTVASPAASVELELTPTNNQILQATNRYEIATIEVYFTYGTREGKDTYSYKILNMSKVT